RVNAESTVAPIASAMRLAFRSKILRPRFGRQLAKGYQWTNFARTPVPFSKNHLPPWLPKKFPSSAILFKPGIDAPSSTLTKTLGEDQTKWMWGELAKARFPHPLGAAPLIGGQFTVPPFPQNGTGGLIGATVNVGSAVSMRLIADPSDWDKTQHGIALG